MSDMSELFSRDPLSLTNDEVTQIIAEMRKKRQLFKANPAAARKPATKLTDRQKELSKLDLGGDLKL